MPRCELCGADEPNLTSVAVSHAELDVCTDCATLGKPLESDDDSDEETNTKYSTSESQGTHQQNPPETEFPDISRGPDTVASLTPEYSERVRSGRKQAQLTINELADRVDENASYIRKIECGEMKPTTTAQMQLEQFLNIDLTMDNET